MMQRAIRIWILSWVGRTHEQSLSRCIVVTLTTDERIRCQGTVSCANSRLGNQANTVNGELAGGMVMSLITSATIDYF